MKKIALIGGVVAVAVICAVMFMGGGGNVSIGKKSESPFVAKAAVPSAELQEVIRDKMTYELPDVLRQYTQNNPDDTSAWLFYGDAMKAISTEYEPFGARHWAAYAYWKGMKLGDAECRKRLLWMVSPASLQSEKNILEYNADKVFVSGESHPNYRYEMERINNALRDIDTSTPEGQKQAEDLMEWGTVVSIISIEDGDYKFQKLFYDWLLEGEPTDEDYLIAAYVTIFTDYLIADRDAPNILAVYDIDPAKFSLDSPKIKEIIDREIKNQSPVGITMDVMLSKPQGMSAAFISSEIGSEIYNRQQGNMSTGGGYWIGKIDDWRKSAPERVKKLESVYDQLDTIGKFVLGLEYISLNVDENYKYTGEYAQNAIDCFKDAQKDPYAINRLSTAIINYSIPTLPESEIKKIVDDIGKEGHDYAYSNPEKSWKTVFSKMESIEWQDITVPKYYESDNIWCRIILCSGTYQGDKISIIFPVYYNTEYNEWMLIDGWTRVLVNRDYKDVIPMYNYIQQHPQEVMLFGLEGFDRKNPPQPSREVAPWMSDILD